MDQNLEYVVRISSGRRKIKRYIRKLEDRGFRYEERAYGKSYLEQKMSSAEAREWKRYCRIVGLTYVEIPAKYTRSSDYRKQFFIHNKPVKSSKYRCAYCGRLVSKDKVTIDHIIPVKKMSDSKKIRRYAKTFGVFETNDLKNLCSACKRCNQRKSAKMGSWVIRGFLGKSELLWKIRKITRFVLLCGMVCFVWYISSSGVHIQIPGTYKIMHPWG